MGKLLPIYPRLKEAYELKAKLDTWFKESNKHTVKASLEICMEVMKNSGVEAFLTCKKYI